MAAESIGQRINASGLDAGTQRQILALLNSLLVDVQALKTALNTHTHGGITTGAGTSGVANAATVGTLNTNV
jgi:hypothetical protein